MATNDQSGLTDYSTDGVDLTLIRWMLSLTPAERLEYLEQRVNDIISIRELNAGTLAVCKATRLHNVSHLGSVGHLNTSVLDLETLTALKDDPRRKGKENRQRCKAWPLPRSPNINFWLSIQIICLHRSRSKDDDLKAHNFVVITLNHPAMDAQLGLGHRFLLRALVNGGVEFILVGSGAEFLNGVPAHVGDVDIVHARDDTNVERILSVLEAIDALFRIQPERRLKLITRYGRLDLWRTLGNGPAYGYEDLLPHSVEIDICDDLRVSVLDLETSIRIREKVGGEKDRAALPILRWTLEGKRRRLRLPLGLGRVMAWVQEE